MTRSAHAPTVQRWQDGWEIPVNVTHATVTDDYGTRDEWEYDRVIVPSLSHVDIAAAVDRQYDGDSGVLAQAQAAALDALAPQVTALTDAVDTLILDSLGGA